MLLNPFEEQLHLPTALVKFTDHQRRQLKIIGQKHQGTILRFIAKTDSS
jgi:hypothetical protein